MLKQTLNRSILIAVATTLATVVGCGPAGPSVSGARLAAPPLSSLPPGSQPVTDIAPGALQGLMGTYGGTLGKAETDYWGTVIGPWVTQPYTIRLSSVGSPGGSTVLMEFSSSGPLGQFTLNSSALVGYFNGFNQAYVFVSGATLIPALHYVPIGIELELALRNGTTFDPTQSRIRFLACGFSQGSCSDTPPGVAFGGDLGKR